MLKRNLVANYLGQGWTALMGLAFVPLYIQYLGIEAYGLIGLFAVMQAWLSLLDLGMTPALGREMARFTGGAHTPQSIRDLLRSLEVICFSLAALIALGVWGASGYLASDWLQAKQLPPGVVAQAISIMALVAALRFCEGLYRGSLVGLQRQVWYNSVNAALATLRHAGAVPLLIWVSPTLEAFFCWQAAVSVITLGGLAASVYRVLPTAPAPAKFSVEAVAGVWKFAGGMLGITVLVLLLTQVDKILLSRLLLLEDFGYYTLAATVASALSMLIGPITQAIYPRMVELTTRNDQAGLAAVYHQGAQLVTVLTALAVLLLSFFAGGVVFLWSGNSSLAAQTAPILSVLVVGYFLNGLMWMPYQCQLAHGWTSLTLKVNSVAVIVLVPALFWVVPHYGAVGAAWVWVILNAGYVLISIHFMHRRLLPDEKWRWYFNDLALPMAGALAVGLLARRFQPDDLSRISWLVFVINTGIIMLLCSAVLSSTIRAKMRLKLASFNTMFFQQIGSRHE